MRTHMFFFLLATSNKYFAFFVWLFWFVWIGFFLGIIDTLIAFGVSIDVFCFSLNNVMYHKIYKLLLPTAGLVNEYSVIVNEM